MTRATSRSHAVGKAGILGADTAAVVSSFLLSRRLMNAGRSILDLADYQYLCEHLPIDGVSSPRLSYARLKNPLPFVLLLLLVYVKEVLMRQYGCTAHSSTVSIRP